jgi:hypothetical protein
MRFDSHELGVRKIRSAGRSTGSVVITLPPELARLEGLDCTISLRGGKSPILVIEPNLAPLLVALGEAFVAMRTGLHGASAVVPLPEQRLRVLARSSKLVFDQTFVTLSLDELGVLRGAEEPARPQDLLGLVRALLALDALVNGFRPGAISDYALALAHRVTGQRTDLDLFMLDMIAACMADADVGVVLCAATLRDVSVWQTHAAAAARLAREINHHNTAGSAPRDARADWAMARRFERQLS